MKYHLTSVALIAVAFALGIQDENRIREKRSKTDLYSVPAPSGIYAAPSSLIDVPSAPSSDVPSAPPSDITSDDSCSTALTTITTTRTVSVVTQIPSSLASVTGTVDLSSFMPPQPLEPTSVTGVMDLSTWLVTQLPSDTVTLIVPGSSSATDSNDSSVAPPQVPHPTASDKPTGTTSLGTTSSMSTAPGLPEFTDAADAVRVPVVVAGVLGWAALLL